MSTTMAQTKAMVDQVCGGKNSLGEYGEELRNDDFTLNSCIDGETSGAESEKRGLE